MLALIRRFEAAAGVDREHALSIANPSAFPQFRGRSYRRGAFGAQQQSLKSSDAASRRGNRRVVDGYRAAFRFIDGVEDEEVAERLGHVNAEGRSFRIGPELRFM